jgi:short-subunit dehydrogenase
MKKVALVTGASSGIGREIASIHAERGGDLIVVARSEDKLDQLKSELEGRHSVEVSVLPKDLTEANAAQEVYDEVAGRGLAVDYLINNAGFGGRGVFHEREWDRDRAMIQLNITALTALCRHFLPDFVGRGSGRILNVSSTASLMPGPLQAVYYATKAYVTPFRDSGVTVTALLPGATETDFARTSGMDQTSLFETTASARSVAVAGYEAMLAGKLDQIAGVTASQRLMLAAVPVTPKKVLLSQVHKMQQVGTPGT